MIIYYIIICNVQFHYIPAQKSKYLVTKTWWFFITFDEFLDWSIETNLIYYLYTTLVMLLFLIHQISKNKLYI